MISSMRGDIAMNTIEERIGKNIVSIRRKQGLSRAALAEKLNVCIDTLKRWEKGKRPTKPDTLEALSRELHVDISTLLGEDVKAMETVKDPKKAIFSAMNVKDEKAAPTEVFVGLDAVVQEWNDFNKEMDQAVGIKYEETEQIDVEFCTSNSYLILFDSMSLTVYGIRDYGMYKPKASDFLFLTRFIPVFTHQPESTETLFKRLMDINEKLQNEIRNMYCNNFSKPIVLISHLMKYDGTNNYIGWSLAEGKYVKVYDYKSYRTSFGMSEINEDYDNRIIVSVQDNTYHITPLSSELISDIGLNLFPDLWEKQMKWDAWEKRDLWERKTYISSEYKSIYEQAVKYIDRERNKKYTSNNCFVDLEARVARFEQFSKLGAPDNVIKDEVALIQKAIKKAEGVILSSAILDEPDED